MKARALPSREEGTCCEDGGAGWRIPWSIEWGGDELTADPVALLDEVPLFTAKLEKRTPGVIGLEADGLVNFGH